MTSENGTNEVTMDIQRTGKIAACSFLAILCIGLVIPEKLVNPVENATSNDWNHNTFWYEPWGRSGVHKVSIFLERQALPSSRPRMDWLSTAAPLILEAKSSSSLAQSGEFTI